ncbi:MAG: glycogen/starch synthase [Chloroflexi bacterium]|nr:glycogen/starch synthase [Chloroflexota bacterium]
MPFQNKIYPTNADTIHILFVAAEADPLVKIGGLGDVAGSLPISLNRLSIKQKSRIKLDIRLAIPYYPVTNTSGLDIKKIAEISIPTTKGPVKAEIFETFFDGITVYLVSGDPIRRSELVYGKDFISDSEKFIFFSLVCLELPKILDWRLDILHAHDWHTAIAVHQLRVKKINEPLLKESCSILTLHNLPFMGNGSENSLQKYRISPSLDPSLPDWAKNLPLTMGFSAADQIVTVSPSYAKEILTAEFSCNLHDFFSANQKKLSGILNGLDTALWDPSTDPLIFNTYDQKSLQKRHSNKEELQKEMGFDVVPDVPLLILISRMDFQKGIDLVIETLKQIRHLPWQVILLGSGNSSLENLCQSFEADHPEKVRCRIKFDSKLSHRMYSAGDILLMPSRYEPCGIAQMIAMRYGCVPVARSTGGLRDTLVNHRKSSAGTGFLFNKADTKSFSFTLTKALSVYPQSNEWNAIQQEGMGMDFSWEHSAEKYYQVYESLLPNFQEITE